MTDYIAEPLPLHKRVKGLVKCIMPSCDGIRVGRGYCQKHYVRYRRHGSAGVAKAPRKIRSLSWLEQHVDHQGDDCLTWPYSRDTYGYAGTVTVNKNATKAHRWMCAAVNGEPETPDMQCCHSCGNGHLGCVNPKHLRWGTAADNALDRVMHGRSGRGENHPKSRFTAEQVIEIKRQLAAGQRGADIARTFNVSRKTIGGISEGRVWFWLEVAP